MFSMVVLQVGASRGTVSDVNEIIDMSSFTFYHCENTPSKIISQIETSIMLDIAEESAMIEPMLLSLCAILVIIGNCTRRYWYSIEHMRQIRAVGK